MSQKKDIKKNKNQDLYESTKNEEDLLGFSSKYKTNTYREEDFKENENEQRNIRKRLSGDSTSISQEYSNISGYNLRNNNNNILSKETEISHRSIGFRQSSNKYIDYQEKQRKLSSPICCYYDGSDIFLSKIQKTIIDMDNSPNFIKKDSFFSNNNEKNNNNNDIDNDNDNNLNINLLCQNKNFPSINNTNDNIRVQKNNGVKRLSQTINQIPFNNINNMNRIQNNNIINNNYFLQNNNYNQQIFNINFINFNNFQNNSVNNNISKRKLSYNIEEGIIGNYFNNILNLNNNNRNHNDHIYNVPQPEVKLNPMLFSYNEEQEKFTKYDINRKASNKSIPNSNKNEKKPFDKRKGDWVCPDCHNLNFAFRVICNRCQIPKPTNLTKLNEE